MTVGRDDGRADRTGAGRREPGWVRWLRRVLLLGFVAGLAFAAGFVRFAEVVAGYPVVDEPADGIVALTGGRDRIQLAVELLEQGRGRRLLISGVHPATTAADIRRETEARPQLFACCVDLDHQAETTVGNALETDRWVRQNQFRSVIVVTSAYHMPRSLAELQSSMPEIRLLPHPVKRPELELDRWWARPRTVKLLMAEYVKYILARVRLGLETLGWP
ncbi:YdcF family protein [Prosthecomicrobium sp. N25]|uniref:YdcF family protein n=1 Tax=Prosthecomicrobium sp. N25 TaxID=3129254 RepID=UPI003078938C